MASQENAFASRYGPWALVAGASEGLGAEFARQVAARGLHVVPVARRAALLDQLAGELSADHDVQVRPVVLDLADPDAATTLQERTADLDVGLLVYNAALSPIGEFLDQELGDPLRALDLNCRTLLALLHAYGRAMRRRGRGGLLLMSSMSAFQGSPLLATYAATKAFDLVLGEALWEELQRHGIDVLAFCAGATRTPNYEASRPKPVTRLAPPVMVPTAVVSEALARLGAGPSAVAGRGNRLAGAFISRLLPRRAAVRIMGRNTRAMYSCEETPPEV